MHYVVRVYMCERNAGGHITFLGKYKRIFALIGIYYRRVIWSNYVRSPKRRWSALLSVHL